MIGKEILHYKILSQIGGGGMGIVYEAEDTKLKRTVALKFLPPEWTRDPGAKARMLQEAQAASKLDHNNICTIHEVNETEDGQMFIAMARYQGQTLKEVLDQGQPSQDLAIDIAKQICLGLGKAHEQGIVHRDIKPANIMIDNDGTVKILDFGLAKLAGQAMLTQEGTTLGTGAYMSPEQSRGDPSDARTDVWGLGVVLYQMLTGKLPFKGDYDQAVVYSIINEEPEYPSEMAPRWIPILKKCLNKDLDGRYQNARDLLHELESVAAGNEPIGTSTRDPGQPASPHATMQAAPPQPEAPPDPPVKSRKPVRSLMYAGAVVLLIVLIFLIRPFLSDTEPTINAIAVLPFVNSNNDPDVEFLGDGLTESLINQLSKLPQLKVMSRSSVFRFKGQALSPQQIGEQLNVSAVLLGTIVQRGDDLRIHAELVSVEDGAQIWGEQYNRTTDDIFAVQDAISEQISTSLKLQLTDDDKNKLTKRHTENTEAYQLYLKGRHHWNKRTEQGLNTALRYFQEAIDLDPGYGLAYAAMAESYVLMSIYGIMPPIEGYPKGKQIAARALQIDEELEQAHSALGFAYAFFDRDWEKSEDSFQRALALNPNYATAHHWYGDLHMMRNRLDAAVASLINAQALDPLSLIINSDLGSFYVFQGRNDLAKEAFLKSLALDSTFFRGHTELGLTYALEGNLDQAIVHLTRAIELQDFPRAYSTLAYAYAEDGQRSQAENMMVELQKLSSRRNVSAYDFAVIHTALGNHDEAFRFLDQAVAERSDWALFAWIDRRLQNLHEDPRYAEFLKAIDAPEH